MLIGNIGQKSNQDWLEGSIKQSVSDWKQMLRLNKENTETQNQPTTWINEQYQANQIVQQIDKPKEVSQITQQP